MYKIDREKNEIAAMEEHTFADLGFKERQHLQEWLCKDPDALGEELLVIQKEFAGFSDTQERLDLLALDKQGSLVIIENKLDDSGKGVTWQALRYASYCSTLSKKEIRQIYQEFLDAEGIEAKAEDRLSEFFDDADFEDMVLNEGLTQRLIFVAAKFRREVTSTVLWLRNFNLQIQCFKVTPYSNAGGKELFLNVEQIIPIPDAEEYTISMANKAQEERKSQRKKGMHSPDLTQYLFCGERYGKGPLVVAVIHKWIADNQPKTYADLLKAFPLGTHNSGHLFVPLKEAEEVLRRSGHKRHFLHDDEIIRFGDSSEYAITSQWGIRSIPKFLERAEKLNLKIQPLS